MDFRKILCRTTVGADLSTVEGALFGDPPKSRPQIQFQIDDASQGADGLEMVRRAVAEGRPYLLAFVDMRMPPGWDGPRTIQELWKVDPNLQVVICTAFSDSTWEQIVRQLGSTDRMLILKKPFDDLEVCQCATALTQKWLVTRQANLKVAEMERLVLERTVELMNASLHDGLTGLPNRQLFNDRLSIVMEEARRDPAKKFAVLFLDFDRFKFVNDSLGHQVGDMLLCSIAERIRATVRGTDSVVSASEIVVSGDVGSMTAARIGGDEFIILLNDLADHHDAARVAQRLLDCLSEPYNLQGNIIHSTVSIGVTTSAVGYTTAEAMVRDADAAMYRAKAAGKAQYVLFDKDMHERAMGRLQLEGDLRKAAERGELRLHYQPVICLETGVCQGVEALVRWQHPMRGLLQPNDFIPAAEETGIIVEIDAWALGEACRQLTEWKRRNRAWAELEMSVNISRRQLRSTDVVRQISAAVAKSGVDPRYLKLEFTESSIMDDPDAAIKRLLEIKQLHVRLMMDNFGTANSSLSCLHRFPLDGLKIDRAFVKNAAERRDYAAVAHAIITLAKNLDMQIVAEGVETAGQTALLQSLGCELAQGYHFARPMPAEEAESFLLNSMAALAAA